MKHSKEFLRRSKAAKLGWKRRRVRERKDFLRRSRAAKRGWATRRRALTGALAPSAPFIYDEPDNDSYDDDYVADEEEDY